MEQVYYAKKHIVGKRELLKHNVLIFIANGKWPLNDETKVDHQVYCLTYLNTNFSRSSISIAVPGVALFGGDSLLLGGC